MNFKQLTEMLQNGSKPVVIFGKKIEETDSYAELHMRARIVGFQQPEADVIKLLFDFEEFSEFNKPLEPRNYYDKAGAPTLTAREAGYYRPQDYLYFSPDEAIGAFMQFEDDESIGLFKKYLASGTSDPYIRFLERLVLSNAQMQSEKEVQGPAQEPVRSACRQSMSAS